jgi:hypothetical protein
VGDPSFRLKNGCTQDDPDTWAEDFKLSHYRSLNNIAFCHSESERFGGEETAAGREKADSSRDKNALPRQVFPINNFDWTRHPSTHKVALRVGQCRRNQSSQSCVRQPRVHWGASLSETLRRSYMMATLTIRR